MSDSTTPRRTTQAPTLTAVTSASPRADFRPPSAEARLDVLLADVRYELAPLIRAAELLADFERVHQDFEFWAERDPAFGERLSAACESWRNPYGDRDGDELASLLRVAVNVCAQITRNAEATP